MFCYLLEHFAQLDLMDGLLYKVLLLMTIKEVDEIMVILAKFFNADHGLVYLRSCFAMKTCFFGRS